MYLETFVVIRNISSLSVLIPLFFFAIAVYKRKQPYTVWLTAGLIVLSALSDLLSYIFYTCFKLNANPVISIYVVLQFILVGLIYRKEYTTLGYKTLTDIVSVLYTFFFIINFIFIQGINGFSSNAFMLSGILLLTYSVLFCYQLVRELPDPNIERIFMFWISGGLFFYFGINLFLFTIVDRMVIQENTNQFLLSWGLHNGSNAIKNLLFAIGFHVAGLKNKAE